MDEFTSGNPRIALNALEQPKLTLGLFVGGGGGEFDHSEAFRAIRGLNKLFLIQNITDEQVLALLLKHVTSFHAPEPHLMLLCSPH